MAFPADPLPIRTELLVDSVWTDYTDRVRGASPGDITIKRGFSSEQSALSPGTCAFTLNNRDGLFSFRNPNSALHRKVGRGTQIRHGVEETDTALWLADVTQYGTESYDGARAWTADKAVLDITGDLDVRVDVHPEIWRGGPGIIFAGKYNTSSDQRSWTFGMRRDGVLELIWSTDGTSGNRQFAQSTSPAPTYGRKALRVTLDVNNGAGGWTATFYSADTIDGTWTSLGGETTSGTTSIFASTAALEVGTINNGAGRLGTITDYSPFVGKIYAFELRNGIAGTLVAQMDATSRPEGNASWSDGLATPNTWTLEASAWLTPVDYRFTGDLAAPPVVWDSTGRDVYVPAKATDIFGRLNQADALHSSIYRNLVQYNWDGYWSCEDGFSSSRLSAVVGSPGTIYNAEFGNAADLEGTEGALVFSDDTGEAEGVCSMVGAATGTCFFMFYFKLDALPGATRTFMTFTTNGGTIRKVALSCDNASFSISFYDLSGDLISTSPVLFGTGGEPTNWLTMKVSMVQNGALVDWGLGWYPEGAPTLFGTSGSLLGRTVGRPNGWHSPGFTGKFGMELAHVVMAREQQAYGTTTFVDSTNAYVGERARARFIRLCQEEGVPWWFVGTWSVNGNEISPEMGPQTPRTLKDLLIECADADGGMLYAPRDKYGVTLHSRTAMLNQSGPEFDYSTGVFGAGVQSQILPDEDFPIQNDITVTQPDGSFARRERTSGPLNVGNPADDPEAVGRIPVTLTRNVQDVSQLEDAADWALTLGTWDEARWTAVPVELARSVFTGNAALAAAATELDIARAFSMTGLPDFLPPEDAQVYVRGYTEVLRNRGRSITWNTAPYTPYLTGVWDSAARRVDSGSTLLAEFIDASETSWDITTTELGDVWSTTAVPYYWITPAGEVVRVDAMTASAGSGPYTQTATVTRSINGVVATHELADEIHIYMPATYAPGGVGGEVVAAGEAIYAADLNQLLNKPMVRLVQQSAQSIADGVNTALTFGTGSEDWDTHNFHNTSSNTSRITPTVAGYYTLRGTVFMASSTAFTAIASSIAKNGNALPGWTRDDATTTGTSRSKFVEVTAQADGVADYFELFVSQSSGGGARNTNAGGSLSSFFECIFERPL